MRPRALLSGSLLVLAAGGLGAGCDLDRAASSMAPAGSSSRSPAGAGWTFWKEGAFHVETLPPGQIRSFDLHLSAGQYLHLVIEQLGVDVVSTIRDSADRLLLEVDSPSAASGPEDLFFVASRTGRYVLAIEAWGEAASGGRFALRIESLHPATERDRRRASAARAYSRGRLAEGNKPGAAAARYQEAAWLWEELGDESREAWALFRLGRLYRVDPARRRESVEILGRALGLFRRTRQEEEQAHVLTDLGKAWLQLEEAETSGRQYEQAIAIWEKLGNVEEWASRLNDLAIVRVRQGRIHTAIDLYTRAVEIWQKRGIQGHLATTRTNLGHLYASLGESRLALDQYRRALALLEQEPDSSLRAVLLNKLGDVLLQIDGPEAALEKLREALELRRRQRDTRGQAVTLNSIGQAQLEANRPLKALRAFEAAAEIFRRHRERSALATVLNNLGLAYERLGRSGRVRDLYRQALEQAAQVDERALFGLARVARMDGELEEAESRIGQSLDRIEEIRRRMWRPDLRSSYQAARQEHYAFLIDLLAERHQREPQRGHAARAFAVAERARARSLLDLLSAARQNPRPEELRRLDELSRQINDRHRDLLAVSSQGVASDELESELTGLLESLRQAEAAVEGPRLVESDLPPTRSLHEVQTGLLDEETLFLEYFLGEKRSFLWAVTPTTMRFVATLPGRERLETTARRAWERMGESHRQTGEVAARQAAARLSEMILGPVADLLHRRRLVIVAPGALQLVPFAALPRPDHTGEPRPLILDHEIVSLPSASVLGSLRSRLAGRRPPPGLLAVVADPALGPVDLPFARREAEAILSLAGTEPVLAAFGAAASRELVQSSGLRDYRILHFATHGLYNDVHPELSALALSAFDSSGRPVDGHLRAYEVSSLDLRADLVVLSACRTALGKNAGGEGLAGLTHGFLHAGVPRLVVSLWDVDDRATSELMKRFYVALLQEKLSPAEALRKAQIDLLREERWRAPYYWAGFIFQGEWRSSR